MNKIRSNSCSLDEPDVIVRRFINRFFIEKCHVPTINDIATGVQVSSSEVASSLHRLRDEHRLLLYPDTDDIWVAHPFSAIASNYWIEAEERGWWGNCGFCSLGVAAMLKRDVVIRTRLGGEGTPAKINIISGLIEPLNYRLHVPLPIARWHENVIYTCGNVHVFRSDDAVKSWCERHNVPHGQTLSLRSAWNLAQRWYGNYLEQDWVPASNESLGEMLRSCDLDDPFWHLPIE